MQLHDFFLKTKHKTSRRVGRGGKRGTYSGRGTKGQHARAGAKIRPEERDIIKRIPKLRGFKFKSFGDTYAVLNLRILEKSFAPGSVVSPQSLLASGLISRIKGRIPKIKILGHGELKKNFTFKNVLFSKTAATKVNPGLIQGVEK